MADTNPQRRVVSLQYPGHLFDPEDLLSFVESSVFQRAWKRCGLNDDDLYELQVALATNPKGSPVVEGTGGLRKARFSPTGAPRGKSGSHRACYAYYEEFGIILLVTAYPKNRQDDLSSDARKAIRGMLEQQRRLLHRGQIK
jgi:hypothetical protein